MTQNNPNAGPSAKPSPAAPKPPVANPPAPIAKPALPQAPSQAAKPAPVPIQPTTPKPAQAANIGGTPKQAQAPVQIPAPKPAPAANVTGTPKPATPISKPPVPAPVAQLASSPLPVSQPAAPIPADPLQAAESRAVKWIVGAFVAGTIFCVAVIVVILLVWSRTSNQSAVVPAPPARPGNASSSSANSRAPRNNFATQTPATPATPTRTSRRARGPIDYSHIPPTIPRLNYAARRHDIPSVEQFIAQGDDINGLSREGFNAPPIVHALAAGNDDAGFETVKTLLNHGADPNGHSWRHSALIEAILHRSIKSAELLLEKGADPTWQAPNGDTALTYAQNSGNKDMVKLIQEGLANWKPAGAAATKPAMRSVAATQP